MTQPQPPDREVVAALVMAATTDVMLQRGHADANVAPDTRLVGASAVLDSLGLVTLVVDLEQRVQDELGYGLTLANERAMSRTNSPFLSVGTLTDYIHGLIVETITRA
ncbi:MAG: hypothetical protein JNL48_08975 [Acidobacteria bacterium]|nr:hypothetical protein [Acidobacteriota bacterium]